MNEFRHEWIQGETPADEAEAGNACRAADPAGGLAHGPDEKSDQKSLSARCDGYQIGVPASRAMARPTVNNIARNIL
jgi:hypothetical protein